MRSWKEYGIEREWEKTQRLMQKHEKKRRKIIRAAHEPLLPTAVQGLFLGLVFLLPAAFLVEMIVTLEGKRTAGIAEFLYRSGWSLFHIWLIFGSLILLLCAVQLIRIYDCGYEEKIYRFADEIPEKEFFLYSRVNAAGEKEEDDLILYARTEDKPAGKKYGKLIKRTAAVGAAVFVYYGIALFLY